MPLPTIFNPGASRMSGHEADAIVIDDDNEDAMQIDGPEIGGQQQQHRQGQQQRAEFGYNPSEVDSTAERLPRSASSYASSIAQEKKIRSKLREGRHAALCVLTDRELLMIQALSAHETIPQTRRRFLAQLMAPDDPAAAASIRADRFTTAGAPQPVPRTVIDVYESDDAGWRRPDAGTPSKSKGKTPERDRDRARRGLGRQQRERERRRRWSGAEREFESQAV